MPEETRKKHAGFMARYLANPKDARVVGKKRSVVGQKKTGELLNIELVSSECV